MRTIKMLAHVVAIAVVGLTMNAYGGAAAPETAAVKKADPKLYAELPTDIVLGETKAPVTIIEYSSLSCPHCANFQQKTFPEIKKLYIDTGKVKFIHRDFPLDEPALRGAILTHCAGKDRYYTFLKVLFDKQENWAYQKNYLEILTNIGKLGGLSGEKIDACMKDKALETAIVEGKLLAANSLDITSTPTFFINGEKHRGTGDVESFKKMIDKVLAAPKEAPANDKKVQ